MQFFTLLENFFFFQFWKKKFQLDTLIVSLYIQLKFPEFQFIPFGKKIFFPILHPSGVLINS